VLVALGVFVAGEIATRAFGLVDRVSRASRLLYAPGPSIDLPYVLRPRTTRSRPPSRDGSRAAASAGRA
jgi:hypothetical protein